MQKGPLLNLGATFAFAAMFAMVKGARAELDPFAVMFWRCLLAIPLGIVLVGNSWRVHSAFWIAVRVVLGFSAMTCFFVAARDLPLARDVGRGGQILRFAQDDRSTLLSVLSPRYGRAFRSAIALWKAQMPSRWGGRPCSTSLKCGCSYRGGRLLISATSSSLAYA